MAKMLLALAALISVAAPVIASPTELVSSTGVEGAETKRNLSPGLRKSDNILIVHAVLAVLAWTIFMPTGAIILRLNLPSAPLLKAHAYIQMGSFLMYTVALGLGIWIARESAKFKPTWSDPHVIIGLLVFGAALFQPALGWIHHHIFRKQLMRLRAGLSAHRPGRTAWARIHLWIGRILITLGIINGGFGIRLAANSPFQDPGMTRKAYIGYGVVAGLMWLTYAGVSALFEYRRTTRERAERHESHYTTRRASTTASEQTGKEFKL